MSNKRKQYSAQFKAKVALAAIRGEKTVSELASELYRQLRLSQRLADCFTEQRDQRYVVQSLKDLVAQRLYGLAQTLGDTELAVAQCGTIRLKLLKISAQIRVSARRILISFSQGWRGQALFEQVYQRLSPLTASG